MDTLHHDKPLIRTWGLWAVLVGALSLLLIFGQISAMMNAPSPSAGSQIGEIAGEIKRAAWTSFLGFGSSEAEVIPDPTTDWLAIMGIAGIVAAVSAIVLSVISGVRGENRKLAAYGTGLGVSAILFHFFWMVALMVIGAMLLVAILQNIGDIFSF